MKNIIDNPIDLAKLNSDDLEDILLDPKYNVQNLRELCKRCVKVIQGEQEYSSYMKGKASRYQARYENIRNKLKELLE